MNTASTVSLVGDIRMCTRVVRDRLASDPAFQGTIAELRKGDLVIGNLEMPLSRRGFRMPKQSNLISDPDIIDDVKAMGIQAVTLANNHMMDYGLDALVDTLAVCDGAGIPRCGAGLDLESALRPLRLDANGARVALISVASTMPIGADAGPGRPGIAPIHAEFSFQVIVHQLAEQPGMMPTVRTWARAEDQEMVCREIERQKGEADLVVVGIHWGVPEHWMSPYLGQLAEYQRPLAHAMMDAGADVICGHHSHTLHPIEVYRGKVCFYSLGNFLFEFDKPRAFMEQRTVIVRATPGNPVGLELVPLVHDDRGVPRLASGAEAAGIWEKLNRISEPFNTRVVPAGDRAKVVAS